MSRGRPLVLELPEDFDLDWAFDFLAARVVPSLETLDDGVYRRTLRLASGPVTLAIRGRDGRLDLRSSPALPARELRGLVTRMLDLDADLAAFRALAARDPVLGPLVARHPDLRLPQYVDPFEGTMRAILGQQVSLAAASTLAGRLVRRFGAPAPDLDGIPLFVFPEPETLAAAGPAVLAEIGLTRVKSVALHGLAAAVADGTLDWDRLRHGTAEEAEAALCALPGIGPWTASYVRMRTLGDRDAFPASDLGVVKALERLSPDGERPTPRAAQALAETWRPFRAYATLHLWNALS